MFRWQPGKFQFICIDSANLETRCWGPSPEQASTIILLHEGLGCVDLWRDFPEKLVIATGMGVFAYSRKGHGRSDLRGSTRPVDFMTEEAVDVLPKVLDAIGFKNGMIIGHSDGASIAAIYAGQFNDRQIRGIVLMAPHFFVEEKTLASIRIARKTFDQTNLKSRMSKFHLHPHHTFNGWCDAWLRPEFADWNIVDVLSDITVPVLAIQGIDDQYGTVSQIDFIEERAVSKVERHILPDCKHTPFLEQPDKLLILIKSFFARL